MQRQQDLLILWPVCKKEAGDLNEARKVFFLHMVIDPAYKDFTFDQMVEYVESLE